MESDSAPDPCYIPRATECKTLRELYSIAKPIFLHYSKIRPQGAYIYAEYLKFLNSDLGEKHERVRAHSIISTLRNWTCLLRADDQWIPYYSKSLSEIADQLFIYKNI